MFLASLLAKQLQNQDRQLEQISNFSLNYIKKKEGVQFIFFNKQAQLLLLTLSSFDIRVAWVTKLLAQLASLALQPTFLIQISPLYKEESLLLILSFSLFFLLCPRTAAASGPVQLHRGAAAPSFSPRRGKKTCLKINRDVGC